MRLNLMHTLVHDCTYMQSWLLELRNMYVTTIEIQWIALKTSSFPGSGVRTA